MVENIKRKTTKEIPRKNIVFGDYPFSRLKSEDRFGFVVMGAGGNPIEWSNGISDTLKREGIVRKGSDVFEDGYYLNDNIKGTEGRKDLVLIFSKDSDVDIGKLSIWRLKFGDISWIQDFLENYGEDYMSGIYQGKDYISGI